MNPDDLKAALADYDASTPDAPQQGGLEVDGAALEQAIDALSSELPDVQQEATPEAPAAPPVEMTEEQKALTPGYYLEHGEPGLGRPDTGAEIAEGALAGAAASMFETKDFLFGEPADDERSDLRASVEDRTSALKGDSILGGAAVSIGQFAMGMYGLGKFTNAAKVLPWFGRAAGALNASRTGQAAGEVAKAAVVGAVAFDPHEERLSNLIENEVLANPITQYLSADPSDSAAEGRFKSALESIGLDLAIIGTLGASLKVYRALRSGDEAGARAAADLGEAEARGTGTPEDPLVLDEVVVGNTPATADPGSAPSSSPFAQAGLTADVSDTYFPTRGAEPVEGGVTVTLRDAAGQQVGQINAREVGDTLRVQESDLESSLQGRGLGVALYEELLAEAAKRGKTIVSDMDVSRQAANVYDALGRRGHNVERLSQHVTSEDVVGRDMLYAQDGEPVFRVTPRAAAETPPSQATPVAAPVADEAIEVTPVPNPTEAAAQAGVDLAGTPMPGAKPLVTMTEENIDGILDGALRDANAHFARGWYGSIEAGHKFGQGAGVPWRRLNMPADVDDFMARVVDVTEDRLSALRGGDVLSDARLQTLVNQRATLFGEDPASAIAMIQQSGQNAVRMVADMEAGLLLSSKMMQDNWALQQRIMVGDYAEFGSEQAAKEALRQRVGIAASVYASARSIGANSGRSLRRMRSQFAITPEDLARWEGMDLDQVVTLVGSTKGDLRSMGRLMEPSLWEKLRDGAQFLYINSLLSGPKTQLINAVSNAYMIGARPLERILGSLPGAIKGDPVSRGVLMTSVRQYSYMGTAMRDGWEQAKEAFLRGDSVMAPHRTELFAANRAAMEIGMGRGWKPMTSLPNVLHNVFLTAVPQAIGLPTRTLGLVDELVKQTVYRSKVLSNAHTEAILDGQAAGLAGADLNDFVQTRIRDKLENAFDRDGRAIYPRELEEAQTATFQNELAQGSLGRGVQQLTANWPMAKFILPFVKTPANVLGYGWRMTPMLNLLHSDFRAALGGKRGTEAQAQAMGQHALGVLFMGSASFLAGNGMVTGGGPSDYKLNQQWRATGAQPYSIVRVNADGSKTFIPYNRYDPVAIPFGIIADLQDAIAALGDEADEQTITEMTGGVIGALFLGLTKQFSSKTYLQGLGQFMDAVSQPDEKGPAIVRQMAGNFIPYSAMQRQFNQDPYLREARTVADAMLATVPGLSPRVPARYDAFGDPILARRGLWSSDKDSAVDREMQRLAIEAGNSPLRVLPTVRAGVDLREVEMADGRNAYEVYQQLSGHLPGALPLKELVHRFITSKAYQSLPDGEATTQGTKSWALAGRMSKYRSAALKRLEQDPNVRQAFLRRRTRAVEEYRANTDREEQANRELGEAFGVDLGTLFTSN